MRPYPAPRGHRREGQLWLQLICTWSVASTPQLRGGQTTPGTRLLARSHGRVIPASLSYPVDRFGHVPRIAAFYGIVVFIYSREHGVAHFHARLGDHEAVVAIDTGEVLTGGLPRREAKLVAQWWSLHQAELADAWRRASQRPRARYD